ncbi:hypothetical protein [Streptomyces sp. NPDC014727]
MDRVLGEEARRTGLWPDMTGQIVEQAVGTALAGPEWARVVGGAS